MSEMDPLMMQQQPNKEVRVHKKHSKEYEMKKMQRKQNIKRFQNEYPESKKLRNDEIIYIF